MQQLDYETLYKSDFQKEFSQGLHASNKANRLKWDERSLFIIEKSVEKSKKGIAIKLFHKTTFKERVINSFRYIFSNKIVINDEDSEPITSILLGYYRLLWLERNNTEENSVDNLIFNLNRQIKGERDKHDEVVLILEQNLADLQANKL